MSAVDRVQRVTFVDLAGTACNIVYVAKCKRHPRYIHNENIPPRYTVVVRVVTGNPSMGTGNYSATSNNMKLVDGWAVTFGTARRGLGGASFRSGPSLLYQM